MARVGSPDSLCVEIDGLSGRRYDFRKGIAEVSDRDAKAIAKAGGFVLPIAGMGRRASGYRCQSCGFGTWFKTCSRCGGSAVREDGTAS